MRSLDELFIISHYTPHRRQCSAALVLTSILKIQPWASSPCRRAINQNQNQNLTTKKVVEREKTMKEIKKITIGVSSIRGVKVAKMGFAPVDANGRRAVADIVGQAVVDESYNNTLNIGARDIYLTARACVKIAKTINCKVSAFVREVLSQTQILEAFDELEDANSELSKAAKVEKRAKVNLFLLCGLDALTETAAEAEAEDDPEFIAARARHIETLDALKKAKERAKSARAAYKNAVETYTSTTKIFQANA